MSKNKNNTASESPLFRKLSFLNHSCSFLPFISSLNLSGKLRTWACLIKSKDLNWWPVVLHFMGSFKWANSSRRETKPLFLSSLTICIHHPCQFWPQSCLLLMPCDLRRHPVKTYLISHVTTPMTVTSPWLLSQKLKGRKFHRLMLSSPLQRIYIASASQAVAIPTWDTIQTQIRGLTLCKWLLLPSYETSLTLPVKRWWHMPLAGCGEDSMRK